MWNGKRLRELRETIGLSQTKVAEETGCSLSALVKYEGNKIVPSYETLEKLADYFCVPVDYLMGRTDKTDMAEIYKENFIAVKQSKIMEAARKGYRTPVVYGIEAPYPYNLLSVIKGNGGEPKVFLSNEQKKEIKKIVEKLPKEERDYINNCFYETDEIIITKGQEEGLEKALATLPENERKVITERFKESKTLEECGKELGCTRERVRQIEAVAIMKLRAPSLRKYFALGIEEVREQIELYRAELLHLEALRKEVEDTRKTLSEKIEAVRTLPPNEREIRIEELGLSPRPYNCLKKVGINTVGEIISKSEREIRDIRDLGENSFEEIKARLEDKGVSFYGLC